MEWAITLRNPTGTGDVTKYVTVGDIYVLYRYARPAGTPQTLLTDRNKVNNQGALNAGTHAWDEIRTFRLNSVTPIAPNRHVLELQDYTTGHMSNILTRPGNRIYLRRIRMTGGGGGRFPGPSSSFADVTVRVPRGPGYRATFGHTGGSSDKCWWE